MVNDSEAEWQPGYYTSFDVVIDNHVAEITLNRPEILNRCDRAMHAELPDLFQALRRNRNIRSVVLASTGKIFSAGGDFQLMRNSHADYVHRMESFERGKALVKSILELPVPVIVALHADVIGVGATLVLCCDAVVAARTARISDPHVKIGLVAGDGGAIAWPAAVGILKARRHLITGDPISAEEGYMFGLVTDLVDTAEEALPAARALAQRIAKLAPLAVQGTKKSLSRLMMARVYEVLDYSFEQEGITSQSDDLLEAIDAFEQKRDPVFQGR